MKHTRETGFTLLEVLISIVVLSVGLLGMAGLVATGIKNNHTASYRSQATFLADDILDRIRANRTAAVSTPSQYIKDLTTQCDPSLVPTSVPALDLNEWICRVEQDLPAGKGAIEILSGGGGALPGGGAAAVISIVRVRLQWATGLDEDGDGDVDASDTLEFVTTTHL